jgi:hypothetical protein
MSFSFSASDLTSAGFEAVLSLICSDPQTGHRGPFFILASVQADLVITPRLRY